MKNFMRKISLWAITKADAATGKQHWSVYVAAITLVVLLALSLFAVQVALLGGVIMLVANFMFVTQITWVQGCLIAFVLLFLFGGSR